VNIPVTAHHQGTTTVPMTPLTAHIHQKTMDMLAAFTDSLISTQSLFKPILLEKYDGTPSIQKFFQFIKQTDEYLMDGHAPPEQEVSIASKLLTSKAYDFYLLNVLLQPQHW
jgi:hypothetical protein